MPEPIRFDEALTSPRDPSGFPIDTDRPKLQNADGVRGPAAAPITFDDALAQHEGTRTDYQVSQAERRFDFARELHEKFPEQFPDEPQVDSFAFQRGAPVRSAEKANFGASLKAGLVEDPDTKRRLIAESLFPGDPRGADRVGFVEGQPAYVEKDGGLRKVSSGLPSLGASLVANTPEIAGSVIGSMATGNPVTGSALGGAGGRAFKRGISQLAFDEPATAGSVAREMATEGSVNLLAGGLGKGVAKLGDRGRVVDFTPADVRTAEQAREYVKRTTGIDLDLAQASGNRKLIALRNYAARYPGKSAELIQAADEAAEGQFESATNRVLDLIAKSAPSEVAGANGVNAAQLAIRAARDKVYNDVRPLYDAAYAAVPNVADKKILGMLKLPYFDEAFQQGQKIATLEGSALAKGRLPLRGGGAAPDLRSLDYTKRALDDKIEMLRDAGKRQEARALQTKRDEFVAAIDAIPNQQWQQARKRYATLIREGVEPLEQGAVGAIAKVKNPKLATVAARILGDPNVTPPQVAFARAALSKSDPEAWGGLVRQYLGQNLNRAMKESPTGQVMNPAGKFRQAVFGTPQDQAKMKAMLGGDAAQAFDDLMRAAERLSSTPIRGSDTAFNEEIGRQLRGRGAIVFRWLTTPRTSVIQAAEQRQVDQTVEAIAEALLNPAKRSQLRQVSKMAPSTRQALIIGSLLTGQAAKVAASDQIGEEGAPPAAYRP